MEKTYLNKMIAFVKKAGAYALSQQHQLENKEFKADNTLVTETDLAISNMMQQDFKNLLAQDNHFLIDEESIHKTELSQKEIFDHEYLWVLDPIDGTAPYGAGLPTFGISLALVKNKHLELGVIYLPFFDELYICDGEKSYLSQENSQINLPRAIKKDIAPTDIFIMNPKLYNWSGPCYTGYHNTSVVGLSWIAAGKIIGQCNFDHFWDVAAGWAICQKLGYTIYNKNTGEQTFKLSKIFDENWRLKEGYICCHPAHINDFATALEEKEHA